MMIKLTHDVISYILIYDVKINPWSKNVFSGFEAIFQSLYLTGGLVSQRASPVQGSKPHLGQFHHRYIALVVSQL